MTKDQQKELFKAIIHGSDIAGIAKELTDEEVNILVKALMGKYQ